MINESIRKNETRLQAMQDVEMRAYRYAENRSWSHFCTDKPYDRLYCDELAEVWVNAADETGYMLELRSRAMGPNFLKLTKEDVIWLLLEAQEKGWFEDV